MIFDITHWFASLQCQAMKFYLPAEFLGTNMAAKRDHFGTTSPCKNLNLQKKLTQSANALQTY